MCRRASCILQGSAMSKVSCTHKHTPFIRYAYHSLAYPGGPILHQFKYGNTKWDASLASLRVILVTSCVAK